MPRYSFKKIKDPFHKFSPQKLAVQILIWPVLTSSLGKSNEGPLIRCLSHRCTLLEAIKRGERLNLLMYADLLAFPARRDDGLGALGCYVLNGQLSITTA